MKKNNYPKWIDDYAKASYQLFAGNVLKAFQPLDFYHFYPLWYDLWLDRIYQAIKKFRSMKYDISKAVKNFPVPSSSRAVLQKFIIIFPNLTNQKTDQFKEIINFFVEVLENTNKEDVFAYKKNIIHDSNEVQDILKKIELRKATRESAQEIGRIILGMGSLVNGLYNDVVTDMGWDSYGPYDVTEEMKGRESILLIRHFPNLKPIELWPEYLEIRDYKFKDVKIYTIYKDIECRINWLGCHPTFNGSLVDNMVQYALLVDGKFINDLEKIKEIKNYYLKLASDQYLRVKQMNFEQLKQKALLQECYQLHTFFEFLGMDWWPTKEMINRVEGKELFRGLYPTGELIDFDLYCQNFGINYLKNILSSNQ